MSVAEIKSDVVELFKEVGDTETDRTVLSLFKSMLQQYLTEQKRKKEQHEERLLEEIRQYSIIPEHDYMEELRMKQKKLKLTEEERNELLRLVDKVEQYNFERVKRIIELAELRAVDHTVVLAEVSAYLPNYAE